MSTSFGRVVYACVLIFFLSSISLFGDVKINLATTPWYFENVSDWSEKQMKLSLTNSTRVPRKVEGVRFTMPNKPGSMQSYDAPVANVKGPVADGNGADRYNLRVSGMNMAGTAHLNLIESGASLPVTLTTSGIQKAKDFTPYDFQYLVKTGTWAVDKGYKDAKGITVEQVKSIIQEPWFYDSTIHVPDSLGIRGGPNSGGFIDTWYDQEKDIPVWQVQIGLSDTKFQVNGEHLKFSPGLMGEKHPNWHPVLGGEGPMYVMGLTMMQEYMNFDMQLFAGNATNEKQAGCLRFDYDNSGQPVVEAGSSFIPGNDAQQMGPFNYMETSYWQYIYKGFPKFFPFETTPTESGEYVTTPGTGACVGNSPQIANACLISSLYCWYLYELMFNSTEFWAADLFSRAKDELVAAKVMYQAWRYGMEDDNVSGISTFYDREALLNADDVSTLFSNNGYFDLFKPALDVILEGCKYSKTSPNSKGYEIYDYPLSLDYFKHFFYGVNSEDPENGKLGDGGILWHFDLTDDQRIEIWSSIKAAFDIVKGKAPSVTGEYVSFRYDFLLMLRVVKYYLDLDRPIPTEVHFLDLVEKHSDDSNVVGTMTGVVIENNYPYLVKKDRGVMPNSDFFITIKAEDETWLEIDTGAVVEWTIDSNWGYWTAAELIPGTKDSSLKAEYRIVIDSATIANNFGGKTGIGWVRVNDRCFNSTIDTFRIAGVKYPSLQEASALDKDGDGFADSIFLEIAMGTDDGADSLNDFTLMEYAWPNQTPLNVLTLSDLKINSTSIEFDINKSNGFGLGIINMNYPAKENLSVNVMDKVGPAIGTSPNPEYLIPVNSSDKDTLYVTFTESIQDLPSSGTFLAFRGSDSTELNSENIIKINSNSYKFVFSNGALSQFSEVKIISFSTLKDSVGNSPATYNHWVKFSSKGKNEPSLVFASIKDNVGDGYGNLITYKIRKGNSSPEAFSLSDMDSLTYQWNMSGVETAINVSSPTFTGDTLLQFSIDVAVNGTYGDGYGKAFMHFEKGANDYELSGDIIDSVGPAIVSAEYTEGDNGAPCTLTVILTESIEENLVAGTKYLKINGTSISQNSITKIGDSQWQFIVASGTIDLSSSSTHNLTLIHNSGLTDDSDQKNPPLESNNEKEITIVSSTLSLSTVEYYDDDANGIMDKIVVNFASSIDQTTELDLMKFKFTWLDEDGNQIAMNVDGVDFIKTGNSSAEWKVSSYNLKADLTSITTEVGAVTLTQPDDKTGQDVLTDYDNSIAIDKMAPVLIEASYIKYGSNLKADVLNCKFSEGVDLTSVASPDDYFCFWDRNGIKFKIEFSKGILAGVNSELSFDVVSGDEPHHGDSVNINKDNTLSDDDKNSHTKENKKVMLSVLKAISLVKATYMENSIPRDGAIDLIEVETDTLVDQVLLDKIKNVCSLNLGRSFSIDSIVPFSDNKGFYVHVTQGPTSKISTAVTSDDKLEILEDCNSSNSGFIVAQTVEIEDGLAPVIVSAHVNPAFVNKENYSYSPPDTLIVKFSELISENKLAENPFVYLDDDKISFTVELEKDNDHKNDSLMTFYIDFNSEKLTPGDFIKIHTSANSSDMQGNVQESENKEIPVTFGEFHYDWNLVVYPNPVEISNEKKALEIYNNLLEYLGEIDSDISPLQAVIIDPWGMVSEAESYTFSLVLFDGLGNMVVNHEELKFINDRQIWYYLWDFKNVKSREVGSGVYKGYIAAMKNGVKLDDNLSITLGVKY